MTETPQEPKIEFWVRSSVDSGGQYVAVIEVGDDVAVSLTEREALRWAMAAHRVAARAEFDAAVLRQMRSQGQPDEAVALLLMPMRERRKVEKTPPLQLEAGVSLFTGNAFVSIAVKGVQIGQWDSRTVRGVASDVLEAVAAAELDAEYRRVLRTVLDLDTETASAIVADLAHHRAD